jgi:hypothetical protein
VLGTERAEPVGVGHAWRSRRPGRRGRRGRFDSDGEPFDLYDDLRHRILTFYGYPSWWDRSTCPHRFLYGTCDWCGEVQEPDAAERVARPVPLQEVLHHQRQIGRALLEAQSADGPGAVRRAALGLCRDLLWADAVVEYHKRHRHMCFACGEAERLVQVGLPVVTAALRAVPAIGEGPWS